MILASRIKGVGVPQSITFSDSEHRKGKEIGSVLITTFGDKLALLFFIFTWSTHRRKGYATKMIKYLQGEKPKGILLTEPDFTGYEVITTQWSSSTPASRSLLKKLGFVKKEDRLEWSRLGTAS